MLTRWSRGPAEEARAQRRDRRHRLGQPGDPPGIEGAGRQTCSVPGQWTNGEAAWFGWPSDDKIEALRQRWIEATDTPARKELAVAIQARAFEVVPYIPTGQWAGKTTYSKNLKGLMLGPALFQWNVEKA